MNQSEPGLLFPNPQKNKPSLVDSWLFRLEDLLLKMEAFICCKDCEVLWHKSMIFGCINTPELPRLQQETSSSIIRLVLVWIIWCHLPTWSLTTRCLLEQQEQRTARCPEPAPLLRSRIFDVWCLLSDSSIFHQQPGSAVKAWPLRGLIRQRWTVYNPAKKTLTCTWAVSMWGIKVQGCSEYVIRPLGFVCARCESSRYESEAADRTHSTVS